MRHSKQHGFSILGVILVIVVIIAAIGVWAMSGQTNTSTSTSSTADVLASSLISDSSTIKLAYDTLVVGGSSANTITFSPDPAATDNVLDPIKGAGLMKAPARAIREGATEPDGIWVYTKTLAAQVGTSQTDIAVVLAGVKDSVCKRVNFSVSGSEDIPSYTGKTTSASFVTGATAGNPNSSVALDFGNNGVAANGWTYGCVKGSGADQNLFFRVLQPR